MNTEAPPPAVTFTGVSHLAFITGDLDATIRFYRDLLGLPLVVTLGHGDQKHYFFRLTERDTIAFFGWKEATPLTEKRPGVPTSAPRGFDHLALGVGSRSELLALADRLLRAGVTVEGPIDHGLGWSVYFKDPNNIDLELTWDCVELEQPLFADRDPPAAAREGSAPRPEVWPERANAKAPRTAKRGAGHELGAYAVEHGLGHYVDAP